MSDGALPGGLVLRRRLLSQLGVSVSTLRVLHVTNNSVSSISVCRQDNGSNATSGLAECREFASLEVLDLRRNRLESVSDMSDLPRLQMLHLAGWWSRPSSRLP